MPNLEPQIDSARDHFVAWVRWYLKVYERETPSQAALARRIGVSPSAVSQLLRAGSRRRPRFEVFVGFWVLLTQVMEIPMDALLRSNPPRVPDNR